MKYLIPVLVALIANNAQAQQGSSLASPITLNHVNASRIVLNLSYVNVGSKDCLYLIPVNPQTYRPQTIATSLRVVDHEGFTNRPGSRLKPRLLKNGTIFYALTAHSMYLSQISLTSLRPGPIAGGSNVTIGQLVDSASSYYLSDKTQVILSRASCPKTGVEQ